MSFEHYLRSGSKALRCGYTTGTCAALAAAGAARLLLLGEKAETLALMARLGWRDDQGFYEAADALRPDADGAPSLVKSHMAHHQGMALCAICNTLTGDALAFFGNNSIHPCSGRNL